MHGLWRKDRLRGPTKVCQGEQRAPTYVEVKRIALTVIYATRL